jgi:hypothetical protein
MVLNGRTKVPRNAMLLLYYIAVVPSLSFPARARVCDSDVLKGSRRAQFTIYELGDRVNSTIERPFRLDPPAVDCICFVLPCCGA